MSLQISLGIFIDFFIKRKKVCQSYYCNVICYRNPICFNIFMCALDVQKLLGTAKKRKEKEIRINDCKRKHRHFLPFLKETQSLFAFVC